MGLYWIGYDLDKPGQDYPDLIRRLEQLGAKRILKSDWLLPSKSSAKQIYDDLEQYFDTNDRLLVSEQKNHAAWDKLMISGDDVLKLYTDNAG